LIPIFELVKASDREWFGDCQVEELRISPCGCQRAGKEVESLWMIVDRKRRQDRLRQSSS
jgi:hypothetical protein